ncbi:MAG: glycosyltransferase [Paludibacteraceae bacterium]|nr:glycosyltransferase [Paludibacteraceae bacterium]
MRILIFTANIDKKGGGPSRSVPILAKGLAKIGLEVTLMAVESDDMNIHAIDGSSVNLCVIPKKISFSHLEKKILEGRYDIIHNQMIWTPIYHKVAKIARKNNIPYLTTPRGTLEPWAYTGQGWIKTIKKKIAMVLYQKTDIEESSCVLTTAEMEKENMRNLGFKVPMAVIPNGIEIDNYPCRSKEMLDKIKNQVIFLSRIHPKKGIEILIEAWEEIIKVFPTWNLVVVGNGETSYIESLKSLVKNKNLTSSISILPPAFGEEKYRLYSESALFCLPSYSENFGMVVAEALSCGVPVITTKGTPWEILKESKSGWWVDLSRRNLEETFLEAISLGQNELFEMGQRGSKMIQENFYYIEVAKKLRMVYDWILNKSDKPSYVD